MTKEISANGDAAARGMVTSIWIKRAHRGPMDAVHDVRLEAGRGIVGSAERGGQRQVTLVDEQLWREIVASLPGRPSPAARRANLLVRGLSFHGCRGRVLRIGECRLRIKGETRPCERMDEACPGLRQAMSVPWGGGAYAEVLEGGAIGIGAVASWEVEPDAVSPPRRSGGDGG